jgi:branched-chain amino acid aminotransferase
VAPRALAWQDGRVLPASEATVPLLDDGFLRGDAVFEGVLVRGGRTHALDAHLSRMRRSAKGLGIRLPLVTGAITDLLVTWGHHDGALKIIVTRAGNVRLLVQSISWPAAVSLGSVEMPWHSATSGFKSLSYAANMLASRKAREEHADDAIITENNVVMELPTGSLAWIVGDQVRTPDPGQLPILDSVTVRELAKVVEVTYGVWPLEDLLGADEVFIVSATRPALAVHGVDDTNFPAPGDRTKDIQMRFGDHIAATLD